MNSRQPNLLAIGWALLGAFLFTIVFASAKFIGPEIDPIQVVFFNYLGAAIIISLIAARTHRTFSDLKSPQSRIHVARAFTSVLGDACIISAPLFIAYEDATALSLTDGVIAMILAIALLKERAGAFHWLAAMTCLAGAIVIARADASGAVAGSLDGIGSPLFGIGLALFGALFSGSEMLFIKVLSATEKPVKIMLYVNILGTLILAIPAFLVWRPLSGEDLMWLALLGPLALMEEYCWIKALQNANTVLVVPFGYASIPFAAVLGVFTFHQNLGFQQLVGAFLVLVGGILLSKLSEQETV